jgi:hypothetical protein
MPRSARDHADDRARQAEHDVVMSSSADRAELVQLVTFLMSADGTEAEQDAALGNCKLGSSIRVCRA